MISTRYVPGGTSTACRPTVPCSASSPSVPKTRKGVPIATLPEIANSIGGHELASARGIEVSTATSLRPSSHPILQLVVIYGEPDDTQGQL